MLHLDNIKTTIKKCINNKEVKFNDGKKGLLLDLILFILLFISYEVFNEKSLPILIVGYIIMLFKFIIKDMKKDLLSISSLFLIHYSMYLLYIPIRQLNKNYTVDWYYLAENREVGTKIVFICGIVALMAFILGFHIKSLLNKKNIIKPRENKLYFKVKNIILLNIKKYSNFLNAKNFSYFLIFVGTMFFFIGIWKMGGINYLISKYEWNSDKLMEIGIMTTGIQISFAGIAFSFYIFLKEKKFTIINLIKWPVTYIFTLLAIIKFLQGGRIQVLMICVTLVALYHYGFNRIKLKEAIIILVLAIMILGYIGYYRDYKTLIPSDIRTMIKYVLGGSGGLEYFLNSYTNFTTMHVINTSKINYLWGASILDGIIFLIPRLLLPNKNEIIFINKKIQELNSIEIISPVGGLNLAAQNLINGNIIFTILFMVGISFLFIWLSNYRNKSKHGILFYSLILPYLIISLIRNPMHYAIKEIIQFCIIPYIIFNILKAGECYKEKNNI